MLGMKMSGNWLKSGAVAMLIALLPLASASAGDSVPKPVIQKGEGAQCVEDTDFMRRNHMKLLSHHRDKTMREGVRTKQHSLKNCIDCHATPDEKGQRTVLGKDHFCQSCHSYAAVQVDCFQCHSSKPAGNAVKHPIVPAQTGTGAQTAAELRHHARTVPSGMKSSLSVKELTGVVK